MSSCSHRGIVNAVNRRWRFPASTNCTRCSAASISARRRWITPGTSSPRSKSSIPISSCRCTAAAEFRRGDADIAPDRLLLGSTGAMHDRSEPDARESAIVAAGAILVCGNRAALAVAPRSCARAGCRPGRAARLMDDLMWGRGHVGGPFDIDRSRRQAANRCGFPRQAHAGIFRLHYVPGHLPDRTDADRAGRRQARRGGRRSPAAIHFRRSRTATRRTCSPPSRAVPSAPDRAHRNAGANPRRGGCLQGLLRKIFSTTTARNISSITPASFTDGPIREYLGFFPPGTSADRMVEIIRQHLATH